MKKYGDIGVFAVASYLGLQYLWAKRRATALTVLAVLSILGVVLASQPLSPHRCSIPTRLTLAHPAVTNAPVQPDISLLTRATRVLAQKHVGASDLEWGRGYQWLSNHQLLLLRTTPFDGENCRPLTLGLYDLTKQKETPLTAVNARLNTSVGQLCDWELSPNRQWLLVHLRDGANFLHLDGTGLHVCPTAGRFDEVYWVGSGRRWLDVYIGMNGGFLDYPELTLRDTLTLQPVRKMVNTPHNPLLLSEPEGQNSIAVACSDGGYLLTFNVPGSAGNRKITQTALIRARDGRDATHPLRIMAMPLPEKGRVAEARFSPDARQVAYILLTDSKQTDGGQQVTNDTDDEEGTLSLWVSDWASGKSHRVGSLPCRFSSSGYDDAQYPAIVQWLPDGGRTP
jgi:hypothetical protein